ncbi:hypothetical protein [Pseudomonas helleri]|uniref:hypothetical protein n=1 Tax=Pseudomonas helleri TaxID=1608996 RepID=UPI003F978F43
MAVQPGPTFKRYAANGAATVYTIPFLLLDPANLQVTLNGVAVTSGFTLAGLGNASSSCTFAVAPAGDLLFQQVMQFQRLTDYQMNGDFLSQTVNGDYDRLWLAIKQLNRDDGRALAVSPLEPEGIPALPVKALRNLKLLAFDAAGNPAPSNLTLLQLEQQPALALESAAEAKAFADEASESADRSGDLASQSSDFAVAAEVAAASSASSASIASAISKPFPSTADGVAATSGSGAANRYFSVPITGTSLAILYRNDAGTAIEMGRVPSSELVESMEAGEFPMVGLKMTALAKETGYAWALVDSVGRAALLVKLDGTVEIPKYGPAKFFATELNPETGYVWVVRDSVGRIALGVKTDGTVVAKLSNMKIDGLQVLQPTTDVWCLGDSLTGAIYNRLAAIMPGRKVVYGGAGGQTSVQIAARAGGNHALLSVTGNSIPASGPIAITALSTPLLSQAANTGTSTLMGWLSGVYGSLICTHGASDPLDTYTFTRAAPGSPTYCIPNSPFTPDTEALTYGIPIIFMGTNNPTSPDQIKADIEALVDQGPIVNKRFLILTPVMGGSREPGVSTSVGIGSDVYNGIKAVEDWATKKYGARVLKMREWSMQFNDGSPDDLDDVAKGVVPRSLRTDSVHWVAAHSNRVAELIKSTIENWGW